MTSWPTDVIRRLSQLDAVTSQWRGLTLVLSWTGARLDSAMTSHARMNGGSVAAVSPPSGNTDNYSHSQVLHDFVPHSWFKFHFISLFVRRSHQMQKNLYCPSTKYLMSSVTDSLATPWPLPRRAINTTQRHRLPASRYALMSSATASARSKNCLTSVIAWWPYGKWRTISKRNFFFGGGVKQIELESRRSPAVIWWPGSSICITDLPALRTAILVPFWMILSDL